MRIASYNIMSGGFAAYDPALTTPERLPELKAAIKELGADVIGLVDTFMWDRLFSTKELCEIFSYRFAFCINLNDERLKKVGHNNGLALLSNVPIARPHAVRIASRDALAAYLPGNLMLVLAYLDDLSEDTRLAQVKALASTLNTKGPTIVMGDLNALSKRDLAGVREALKRFYAENPGAEEDLGATIADMQRSEVVALLKSIGLLDAGQTSSATYPTKLLPVKSDRALLRLDYCFHSPSVKVTNFTVPAQGIFKKASDHFPIVFDLQARPDG